MHSDSTTRRRLIETSFPPAAQSLIETPPRIEIPATPSFQRRKHFLIETRMCASSASRTLVPGTCFHPYSRMTRSSNVSSSLRPPAARTRKINRDIKLLEPPVSHSKQRAAPQINRDISATPRVCLIAFTGHYSPITFSSHSSLATTHFSILACIPLSG